MNAAKLDDIFNFLSEHNFEIDENVPDKLMCGKCNELLLNSYIGSCLCRFCRKCIDEMLTNGTEKCPGETDDCSQELLSNFLSDNPTNFKISKLVLKCPEQMCSHKCEIFRMEEHWRMCPTKCTKCIFHGCNDDRFSAYKMSEFLQIIENLRNELNVLKESGETNKLNIHINKEATSKNMDEIEMLKENEEITDESIAAMDEEIQTNKGQIKNILKETAEIKNEIIIAMNVEIQRNKAQLDVLNQRGRMKDDTIAEIQKEIRSIKIEKQQMAVKINNYKLESENKMAKLREEMKKEFMDNLGKDMTKINDEIVKLTSKIGRVGDLHLLIAKEFNEVEKWHDKQIDGTIVMRIDQISDKNWCGADIFSEIFYPRNNPYKMQLWMGNDLLNNEFGVALFVHSGEHDARLNWPFHGNITITISNKALPDSSITITKHYTIPQPEENSYRKCKPFTFSYEELSIAGLMQDDYIIIECRVE